VANIKSQIKRNRQNERLRLANKAKRSALRTRVKVAVEAASGDDDAQAAATLKEAVRSIDRAAAQGIIHKNQAANRKSRLMKKLSRPSA
jgi:small subunit ribosomal protein S20